VKLHLGDGAHLVRETLDALCARLDPDTFVRIHRSHVVNLDHVSSLVPWSHGDYLISLTDGSELRLSRRFKRRLPEPLRRQL
jgi:two-component system LytT family response regulator